MCGTGSNKSAAFALPRSKTACIVGFPNSLCHVRTQQHSLVEELGGVGGVGGGGAGLGGAGGGRGRDGGIAIGLTSDSVKLFKAAREQCLSVCFRECSEVMHWNKQEITACCTSHCFVMACAAVSALWLHAMELQLDCALHMI